MSENEKVTDIDSSTLHVFSSFGWNLQAPCYAMRIDKDLNEYWVSSDQTEQQREDAVEKNRLELRAIRRHYESQRKDLESGKIIWPVDYEF